MKNSTTDLVPNPQQEITFSKPATLDECKELVNIQGESGNWNYSPYMHGMFNGMELMLATLEGREPNYKDAPEHWLEDGHPTQVQPPAVLARMLVNRKIFSKN